MTPGPGTTYSNFGDLILGEVLQASAPGGYLGYLASDILSAAKWGSHHRLGPGQFPPSHAPPAGTAVQDWAQIASDRAVAYLDLVTAAGTWPSERCDGFWVRLGAVFARQLGGSIKMGDTPSLAWLLRSKPSDPSLPGWGGQFVRAWERPRRHATTLPSPQDQMEVFGILELALPLGPGAPENPRVELVVENQSLAGECAPDGTVRFRFCPKEATTYAFVLKGNVPVLQGRTGGISAVHAPADRLNHPSANFPNWWTDDPSPDAAAGPHAGARTVNRWREDFLRDFAQRLDRGLPAAPR